MKIPGLFVRGIYRSMLAIITWQFFILFGFLVGCSDSTDPVPNPEDLSFQYTPQAAVIDFYPGENAEFTLSSSPSVTLQMQWSLNGEPASQDPVFHFDATQVGIDTLRLDYSYSSVSWNHTWYANVEQNPSTEPEEIPWVILEHGIEPADVIMRWHEIPESFFPLVEYQVRVSYDGTITEANWLSATPLGSFPVEENQVGYLELFTAETHGLLAGADAWFAVRGVDEAGQLSNLAGPQHHLISLPWFIEGYVYTDRLEPLPEIIVEYGCSSCRVNTDATGFFSIGPLPNVNSYDLTTFSNNINDPGVPESSWYDFVMRDVQYDPIASNDIVVMTRYDLDESCLAYDGEFMAFFRFMTRTSHFTQLRPNYKLYKWEEYPVPVYVPPFINEHGLDFQSLCREVVEFWNVAMGEEYLFLVDSPEESRIELYFGNESVEYAGRTILAEPSDDYYGLGDVIPEKILVYVWDQLQEDRFVQETAMHEFGHALGLYGHALCSDDGFLMVVNSSGNLENGPENAVHANEKQAIEAIRNLPQGADMSDFQ